MNKTQLKFWWVLAWQGLGWFTTITPTKVDDAVVTALSTDTAFEEFWAFLVSRGWVVGDTFQPTRVQGRKLVASVTAAGESQVTHAA